MAATGEVEQLPGPGTIIEGRYEVGEPLGAGGMASVFRARHLVLEQEVALKVAVPPRTEDGRELTGFFDEAHALGRVRHPNVVQAFDAGRWSEHALFIAMELFEGRDLRAELRERGPLPWPCVKRVAVQIAAALQACHQRGVIHGDLKPANIFLVGTGEERVAKLIDFGSARLLGASCQAVLPTPGVILGTPAFLAPEQVRQEPVDHRADIYAFGCLLHTMVTGRTPFPGSDLKAVMRHHVSGEIPRLASIASAGPIPPGLQTVVDRCMAKRAEDRPASMAEVLSALEALGSADELGVQVEIDVVAEVRLAANGGDAAATGLPPPSLVPELPVVVGEPLDVPKETRDTEERSTARASGPRPAARRSAVRPVLEVVPPVLHPVTRSSAIRNKLARMCRRAGRQSGRIALALWVGTFALAAVALAVTHPHGSGEGLPAILHATAGAPAAGAQAVAVGPVAEIPGADRDGVPFYLRLEPSGAVALSTGESARAPEDADAPNREPVAATSSATVTPASRVSTGLDLRTVSDVTSAGDGDDPELRPAGEIHAELRR